MHHLPMYIVYERIAYKCASSLELCHFQFYMHRRAIDKFGLNVIFLQFSGEYLIEFG